ncbi:MAG: hypothetical protein CMM93_04425 [Rickettsiales bacterium]|nr:hypothetical protein [Rickettsiales bacterium]
MILAICHGNICIENDILDDYCKIRVAFEFYEESFHKPEFYSLHLYTLRNAKVKKFNWRELFDSLIKKLKMERDHEKSILETSRRIKEDDVLRMRQIFVCLMEQSCFESKIAKYFWQYLDELEDGNVASYFCALPRIDPN